MPEFPTDLSSLTLAAGLRAARAGRLWSIAELAGAAGVTPKTVARAEGGENVTVRTAAGLCAALGLNLGQVLLIGGLVAP